MSYLEKPWALQSTVARCAQADGAQAKMKLESPSAIKSTGPGEYAQPPRPRTRAQGGIERKNTGFIAIPDRPLDSWPLSSCHPASAGSAEGWRSLPPFGFTL